MENNNKFDKKKYDSNYHKENTITYAIGISKSDTEQIEKYRLLNGLTKSEFLRICIEYFLENH